MAGFLLPWLHSELFPHKAYVRLFNFIIAKNALNQAFWEAIYTLLVFLWFFRSFCKQKQHFFPSLALPYPPLVSSSSYPGYQDTAINGILFRGCKGVWRSSCNHFTIFDGILVVSATKINISGFVWLSATWPYTFAFKNKVILTLWSDMYCDICGCNDNHPLSDF